ncbi:MAG: hypothetical protein NT166_09880 [Candidatus Aminicenantes bacterium]|nr:hypothetical protein [Candidatus Aminicenantes bacterium]
MRKKIQIRISVAAMLLCFFILTPVLRGETGFTQQDRDTLIELKTTVREMDKRMSDLREDMNKRFEQLDKRFEQMMNFVWILAALFGGMLAVTISFALWDRRTMIRPFETKVAGLDVRISKTEEKYGNLIEVIKEYAARDKKFAAAVERFNIL